MELIADRYELHGTLGVGGMAEVREGVDRVLDRRVAVKLLRPDLSRDPAVRERFLREARNAAKFNHPNAVAVFDTGVADDRPFMVMELVEGETLADRLKRAGALDPRDAVSVTDEVLAALSAAHAMGLVHRDVKPGNIMLPAAGGVKLVDFGIAKGVQEATMGLTATGHIIGTPAYLSPEQVEGSSATPASDVYAMGIVLFEMLAGAPPFTADSAVAVAVAHTTRPVPSIRQIRPEVDAHTAAIVEQALRKDPSGRFADAQQMRAALRGDAAATTAALAGAAATQVLPPTAPMAPLPRRQTVATAPSPARRNTPWLLLGVAALLLLGLAAFALSDDENPTAQPTEQPTRATGQAQDPATQEAPAPPPPTQPAQDDPPATDAPQEPEAPDPSLAGDIPQLIDLLTANPGAYGEKQPEVLDRLVRINGTEDAQQRSTRAQELVRESAAWASEGRISAPLAAATAQAVAPLIFVPEDGEGDGEDKPDKGNGKGKGGKDDGD